MPRLPLRSALLLILWALLAACGSQEQLLNSERIERKFGSYGLDVLKANAALRVSSLYSGSGDAKITRTFAVVRFTRRTVRAYEQEHAQIMAGGSIGAVFKAADWDIEKINVFIGEMEVPAKYPLLSELMQIELPKFLAAHVYVLVVRKQERSYEYATIVELHHPDYLTADDLQAIYGEIVFDDSPRFTLDDYIDPAIWEN
ncbi:MAG: hypothetical protein R3192_04430 [Woeseiaceae bacterium]|nr:hypothetical protein [Woeseiaceae bacterium]